MFKCSNVKYQKSNVRCQMSIRFNFSRSALPEFLRSFFTSPCQGRRRIKLVDLTSRSRGDPCTCNKYSTFYPLSFHLQTWYYCNISLSDFSLNISFMVCFLCQAKQIIGLTMSAAGKSIRRSRWNLIWRNVPTFQIRASYEEQTHTGREKTFALVALQRKTFKSRT